MLMKYRLLWMDGWMVGRMEVYMDGWMDVGMCLLRQEDSPPSSDDKPEEREETCMRSQKPPTSSPAWLAPSAQFPTHSKWVGVVWVWGG